VFVKARNSDGSVKVEDLGRSLMKAAAQLEGKVLSAHTFSTIL